MTDSNDSHHSNSNLAAIVVALVLGFLLILCLANGRGRGHWFRGHGTIIAPEFVEYRGSWGPSRAFWHAPRFEHRDGWRHR